MSNQPDVRLRYRHVHNDRRVRTANQKAAVYHSNLSYDPTKHGCLIFSDLMPFCLYSFYQTKSYEV
ncbi:MAG TPA: hypothetical protein VGE90_14440 [Chitinophaga sp.]